MNNSVHSVDQQQQARNPSSLGDHVQQPFKYGLSSLLNGGGTRLAFASAMETRVIGLRIDNVMFKALHERAKEERISISTLVRRSLQGALSSWEPNPASVLGHPEHLASVLEAIFFCDRALNHVLGQKKGLSDGVRGEAKAIAERLLGATTGATKRPGNEPRRGASEPLKASSPSGGAEDKDTALARRLTTAGRSS